MSENLRKISLVDSRILITSALAGVAWLLCFILPSFNYISVVACIFFANFPCLFFAYGIHLDKGWILSVIGIEDDHVISGSKKMSLAAASGSLVT